MRADDGRIDHLQSRVAHSTSSEPLQDHIPDAAVGPPSKLPKDRIPVAELLRQVAPRRASSHQPKDRVEHTTMVARRPTAAAYQERLEIRPLIVRHQSANHRRSPQRAALNQFAILASIDLSTRPSTTLADLSGTGFPNHFFCDSWVVGFWRGRPCLAGRRIGKKSLDTFSSRFWIGWVTRRGDKCVRSTCRD